ncbi:hypothetical protein M5K25_027861 [Dendrobium thyrsiflorum]|uniref:Uncharacterized protein n=1 Tax=Dendrobium thyrsiflorum TaxID=117978 RepID=A0ABD0TUY5_DENTH
MDKIQAHYNWPLTKSLNFLPEFNNQFILTTPLLIQGLVSKPKQVNVDQVLIELRAIDDQPQKLHPDRWVVGTVSLPRVIYHSIPCTRRRFIMMHRSRTFHSYMEPIYWSGYCTRRCILRHIVSTANDIFIISHGYTRVEVISWAAILPNSAGHNETQVSQHHAEEGNRQDEEGLEEPHLQRRRRMY